MRARRVEATHRPQQGADRPLVDPNEPHEQVLHTVTPGSAPGPSVRAAGRPLRPSSRSNAASRSRARTAWSAFAAGGNARTTTRLPAGSRANRSWTRWRSRRLTTLRTTAGPTALLTTKPARGGGACSTSACGSSATVLRRVSGWYGRAVPRTCSGPPGSVDSCLNRWTTKWGRPALRPRRTAIAKSSRRLSRLSAGSTERSANSGGQLRATLAATGSKDGATGTGAHAQPEPVGLRPATVVRLEGALAHSGAPGFESWAGRKDRRPPPYVRIDMISDMRQRSSDN